MRHRPSGPPFSARLTGALLRAGRPLGARAGRLALTAALTTTVVALLLAIPVISGAGSDRPTVLLDPATTGASSGGPGGAPAEAPVVVMGLDGRPATAPDPGAATAPGAATPGATPPVDAPDAGSDQAPVSDEDQASDEEPAPDEDQAGSPATPEPAPGAPPPAPAATPAATSSTPSTGSAPAGPTTAERTAAERSAAATPAPPARTTSSAPAAPDATTQPTAQPTTQPPATTATTGTAGDPPATVLALVNAGRATSGCGALALDRGLAREARRISTHGDGTGAPGSDGAALVAPGGSPESVVAGWLAEPASSSVLLDCGRTAVGIGTVEGRWAVVVG